jgi:hypothetical protein
MAYLKNQILVNTIALIVKNIPNLKKKLTQSVIYLPSRANNLI